jgi:hypothetical protein
MKPSSGTRANQQTFVEGAAGNTMGSDALVLEEFEAFTVQGNRPLRVSVPNRKDPDVEGTNTDKLDYSYFPQVSRGTFQEQPEQCYILY